MSLSAQAKKPSSFPLAYSETTLRQVVGGKVLQSVISDREALAAEITEILEQVADKWGVAVESVLLKDIVSRLAPHFHASPHWTRLTLHLSAVLLGRTPAATLVGRHAKAHR